MMDQQDSRAAGSVPHPEDDVVGHGEPEAADEAPVEATELEAPSSPDDEPDAEGHGIYARSDRDVKTDVTPVSWGDEAADDTAGHGEAETGDEDVDADETAEGPTDDPDTEGHKAYARSDRKVKTDITPVSWGDDAADDTAGHAAEADDKDADADETPEGPTDDPDTEGHRAYARSDRQVKTDVSPVSWGDEAADDTAGHGEAETGDEDVDAHETAEGPTDDPDTEGHKAYARSDRNIKTDIVAVSWDRQAR
jgi:hypothetical protein